MQFLCTVQQTNLLGIVSDRNDDHLDDNDHDATSFCISTRIVVNIIVPESCSAYNPNGHFCGLFCPIGKALGIASVENSFPKPLM